MGEPVVTIDLTEEQRAEIVLLAAEGLQNKAMFARLGNDANTVGKGRRRVAEQGLDGLYHAERGTTVAFRVRARRARSAMTRLPR